jgi:dTDP-4-amino-4,6-dideoxygalactose transaminase
MYNAWSMDYKKDDCVNSKLVADTILSLPVHAYLEQHEIATLIKDIKESINEK